MPGQRVGHGNPSRPFMKRKRRTQEEMNRPPRRLSDPEQDIASIAQVIIRVRILTRDSFPDKAEKNQLAREAFGAACERLHCKIYFLYVDVLISDQRL